MRNFHKHMVQLQNLVGEKKADEILQATEKYLHENAYQKMLAEAIWATVDNILDSENMSELDLSLESSAADINETITLCCADCAIDKFVNDYTAKLHRTNTVKKMENVNKIVNKRLEQIQFLIPDECTRIEIEINPHVNGKIEGYTLEISGDLSDASTLTIDSDCHFTLEHVPGKGYVEISDIEEGE